jgi:hypothetical protein
MPWGVPFGERASFGLGLSRGVVVSTGDEAAAAFGSERSGIIVVSNVGGGGSDCTRASLKSGSAALFASSA